MATKSSKRKIRKRNFDSDNDSDKAAPPVKQIRGCPRAGCVTKAPICFARATNVCCGNGYTSRWYHLSLGEHYCNECFEYYYRSNKGGFEEYSAWKRLWSGFGKCECNVREYMMDKMLAYWVKCNLCDKWRQVYRETELSPEYLRSYVCARVMKNQSQEMACETKEDYRVEYTRDFDFWAANMCYRLFIKNAIYAPFVKSFFPDKVGISPSDTSIHKYEEGITEVRPYLHPLQDVVETSLAFCLPPHYLADEENDIFHQFAHQNLVNGYLIVRNTAITLWNLNVKKWVTVDRCMNHITMRGLGRIWLAQQVAPILQFLTEKGFINHGIATIPKHIDFLPADSDIQKHLVIIVGAGLAGLSAARQLTNFGVKVKVLEAADHIGGRATDPKNTISGTESHIVVGCYNNPIVVMCKQGDLAIQELEENCILLDEAGARVDDKMDKRMQFHFEAMLDNNKQLKHEQDKDTSLLARFNELHEQFKDESGIPFSKLEESLLQFHMSNLEYACGSSLANVSSMYWDQNEDHPQFLGPPVLLQDGMAKILASLSDGIDIVNNCEVCSLDYTSQQVQVGCTSGEKFDAAKVIVTTSLDVLKKGKIKFAPDLPESKEITLGCGYVEKIALEFPKNFWAEKTKNGMVFGRISPCPTTRGMFDVFYDLSKTNENRHTLVSYIAGEAIDQLKEKSDEAVVTECVQVLRKLFPEQEVPEPVKSYVSHWRGREHINMSYSYIPIDAGEDAFDKMEQDLAGKVFFAGEATHKQFYQTLAGAYVSGLREAEKVYRSLTLV